MIDLNFIPQVKDIDFRRDGYIVNVWQAIALARDSILDEEQFDKALDALEAILIPSMTVEELKELEEIRKRRDEIVNTVMQLRKAKVLESTSPFDSQVIHAMEYYNKVLSSAKYEFNLLRYKLLIKVAYRVFVVKDSQPFSDRSLLPEVQNVYDKYEGYLAEGE